MIILGYLAIVLFLFFAFLGYIRIQGYMSPLCDSPFDCLGSALLEGFKMHIDKNTTFSSARLVDAMFFNILAFILLSIVMFGITLGILVDAVIETREREVRNQYIIFCLLVGTHNTYIF